jgi:hypothetical protein
MCDAADAQAVLPFSPNPLKYIICDIPDGIGDAPFTILEASWDWGSKHFPDETPKEETTHCQVC